jgi:4-amino-4-deoxy-L-arabinose transferase-like glycosyltransferase
MHTISQFLTRKQGNAWVDISALLLVFAFFFLLFLGTLPFKEPDESRYAEIPREMLESGDFITPRLNYVKYFEKPPLHYWVNALSLSVLGRNEAAARLPSAIFGLCGVLLVYHLGRRLFGRREGLYSAMVLASSAGYLFQSRMNIIDNTLAFCMTATLGCFLLASQREESRKGLYYHLFYLFAALTVLAKGLIGIVLPGGILFLYLLLTRRWRLLREMRLATGICLFLAVCAPWFVLVSLRNPEFPQFFFIHEHFDRFLTKVHGRYEPPWFFIPVLLGGMVPWTFFLPATVSDAWKKRDSKRLFLLLWAGVIFAFFSLSSSKLIPYILPVFPAMALLVGTAVSEALDNGGRLFGAQALSAVLFLFVAGSGTILYTHLAAHPKIGADDAFLLGGIFIVGSLLSGCALMRKSRVIALALLCLTASMGAMSAPSAVFARSIEKRSTRELARIVRERYPDTPLVSYGTYRQGLPFYAGRRVVLAGPVGELEFGSLREKQAGWFIDKKTFHGWWDSPTAYVALISRDDLPGFRSLVKTPVKTIAASGGMVLISNR